jgi:hypothetical protein
LGTLKELRLPEEIIDAPGGKLTVRGVSLSDVIALVRHHGPVIRSLFKEVMDGGDVKISLDSIGGMGQDMLAKSPEIVAELIALAAGDGDKDSIRIAGRLPFPVQIEAIEKIARLTFAAEGGLGKLIETVIRVAQGTTGVVEELNLPLPAQKPSMNGSAASTSM